MLNSKFKDYQVSNTIVVTFTILIVLIINNFLTVNFGFTKDNFILITISLLIIGAVVYSFLSSQLILELFKSDDDIQAHIKETLHELNTPVATIQMNIKILEKKETDLKNIQRLNRISTSCENLLDLYNQMEYNIKEKIDKVTIEKFDIDSAIKTSIDKFQDIKKEITIEHQLSSLVVNCDKNGFIRIMDNLISNSIKYNKQNGSINISITKNMLSIKDTGIGIDTNSLFDVFGIYYQEDNTRKGVGLGLNMVKSYCDKYKIDIKIDSQIGIGTTFYLDLNEII